VPYREHEQDERKRNCEHESGELPEDFDDQAHVPSPVPAWRDVYDVVAGEWEIVRN